MLDRSRALELIVGVKRDATFGPIVLVGAGGIAAEVINDRAIGLAPVTIERAHLLARSLRIWPLLQDFRGRGSLNAEALADAIARLSHLISDVAVLEAEANPILVTSEGAVVLDARVVLSQEQ
jgi:acetyltransferase